jgi:hypothetical protein
MQGGEWYNYSLLVRYLNDCLLQQKFSRLYSYAKNKEISVA